MFFNKEAYIKRCLFNSDLKMYANSAVNVAEYILEMTTTINKVFNFFDLFITHTTSKIG